MRSSCKVNKYVPIRFLLIVIRELSSLFHFITGLGLPVARQRNDIFEPSRTITSLELSESSILGGTENDPDNEMMLISMFKHNLQKLCILQLKRDTVDVDCIPIEAIDNLFTIVDRCKKSLVSDTDNSRRDFRTYLSTRNNVQFDT
uniref:Uncharacterized protein n=1 Tax=Glossina austeni TaxID=7395 RepID=A0A1A9V9M8_GLOAU